MFPASSATGAICPALALNPARACATPHRLHEDVQALVTGTLVVALGVVLFAKAGPLTGGTAGLCGMNVLVLYLQERLGWRAGMVQMVIDSLIVLGALWIANPSRVG